MEQRRLGRFLYLNEKTELTGWDASHFERMIRELGQFRPAVLEANPSLLAKLARYAAEAGREVFQPKVVILTYEFPSRLYLRAIQRAFRCPVVSSYGSTETGYVFMQCEAGGFHQNTASCRVDFQPCRPKHGGPSLGRILVTPFGNPWFALLRFSVGDLIRLAGAPACPCGRREGLTAVAIEGRVKDLTFTTAGAAVTVNRLDAVLSEVEGLTAYQLAQTAAAEYRVRVVSEALRPSAPVAVRRALESLYGPSARIDVEPAPAIVPEPSGKHRLAWSEVPFDADSLFAVP
jgi:phenylacetate-coenzyme A ligase PaaK-like adenylate-forming protein